MLLPLLGSAVFLFAHSARVVGDTTIRLSVETPTISHTPVVGVKANLIADSIVVEKGKRTLTLFELGVPVRTYKIALGAQPTGDKVRRGDGRTPEGLYYIDYKNQHSSYHLALHISYPDAVHQHRATQLGFSPGGDIMIHGLPPAYKDYGAEHREFDWTEGCIAVTDEEIEQIWSAVPRGAPIQIKP